MGLFAILLIAFAGWMIVTGRLQRLSARDGVMLGIAIVGAVMAAKGRPVVGALPMLAAAAWFGWRNRTLRRPARPARSPEEGASVAQARELLGLPPHADADAVRAAHRRLIANVHPDRGGTPALAAQINAARDILLREDARQGRR